MADPNRLNTASITQVTGSDSAGSETYPVKTYPNYEFAVTDIVSAVGTNGEIPVGTTPVVAKVGLANHPNRKFVRIYNSGNTLLAIGFKSATTVVSGADMGEPLEKRQAAVVEVSDAVNVYVVSSAIGGLAVITEG